MLILVLEYRLVYTCYRCHRIQSNLEHRDDPDQFCELQANKFFLRHNGTRPTFYSLMKKLAR